MLKIIYLAIALLFTSFATTLVYHKTQQSDIYYYQGHRLFNKGSFDKAIPLYEKSLAADPSRYDTLKELAYSCLWTGKNKEAAGYFRGALALDPEDMHMKKSLAQALAWDRQYTQAAGIYREIIESTDDDAVKLQLAETLIWDKQFGDAETLLKTMPSDVKAIANLADILSWRGDYAGAIGGYERALLAEPDNADIKRKLADVLSWDRQYTAAIRLYDELLQVKVDKRIWRQKARVLGWAKRYDDAIREYRKLSIATADPLVELEMTAKTAYWDNRVEEAIDCYSRLIAQEPENEEAISDLSQVYSYQSMWREAIGEYDRILSRAPAHFRAKEGRERAALISTHPSLKAGYEFYEADSSARIDDIKRYSFLNKFTYPLNYNLNFNLDYRLTKRLFSDFNDVVENEGKISFIYLNNPRWWTDVFYDFIIYDQGIRPLHTFGASHAFRFFGNGISRFSYERQRLENSSTVIRGHYYGDNFKERVDIDINKRAKLGLDYLFVNYSDGNNKHEPGLDILYFISLDPKRLALKYRYFYKNFLDKSDKYFSPKGFSTNSLKIDWRHYLNKEEIFFGAQDLYYGLAYECSVDSTGIVSNKFSAEFNWDISQRLNLQIAGSNTESSVNVYRDRYIAASLNYYF
ncbi:MAG: tetratricopeptide repeat protein [Candidatus Omnitrophota bacterium]